MVIVTTNSHRLELSAPYHPALPAQARKIGGKWMGADTGWTFALDQEDAVRSICRAIWGVDGQEASFRDAVTLKVTVDERVPLRRVFQACENPIYLAGREIAASLKNRKGARPGRGVRFLAGKPRCLAAVDVWFTSIPDRSVFTVADVPRCAVDLFMEQVDAAGQIEVLSDHPASHC